MKPISIRFHLCALGGFGWVGGVVAPAAPGDVAALKDLYKATNNVKISNLQRPWNRNDNWLTGDPCSDKWYGISCDGNRVSSVSLYGNNLRGSVPDSFAGLTELQKIDLGNNGLVGKLPDNILNNMKKLNFLRFGNYLTGTLPDWTASKNTLTFVEMNTGFSGTLPLAYLDLPVINDFRILNTKLSGSIPSWDPLRNAESIQFYHNTNMRGTLPTVDKLTRVKNFKVEWNGLTGTLPPLTPLVNIVDLRFWRNSLSGTFPVLPTQALNSLKYLSIGENALQECNVYTPEPSPGVFKSLWYLNTAYNILTGTVPCHRTAYPALSEWRSSNNFLTGTIPCLDNLAGLSVLSLETNSFTGTLPDTQPSGITTFDIGENKLSGTIPYKFVNNLLGAETIGLGENRFSGTVPEMPNLPSLKRLYLQRNSHWTEAVPVQIDPQDFMDLAMDNDTTTMYKADPTISVLMDFGREICIEAMVTTFPTTISTSLDVLYRTEGVVSDLSFYQGNKAFDLSSTRQPMVYRSWKDDRVWNVNVPGAEHVIGRRVVHDDLLDNWSPYCQTPTRYYRLDIRGCHTKPCVLPEWHFYTGERLSGTIPSLDGLPSLDTLHIYGNNMSGVLPDLSHNNWDGSLRVEDNMLTGINNTAFCPYFAKLDELRFDHNEITGTIPTWQCMGQVETVSVGDNPLTGTIPSLVSSNLKTFIAKGTACCRHWEGAALVTEATTFESYSAPLCPRCEGLEGGLLNWTSVPNLQTFDVNNNELSGTIGDVSVLTKMETFDVQSNHLAGTLPYRELIAVGNQTTSCVATSWYFSNNSLWGPVPDLKQPLGTRTCNIGTWTCYCGRYSYYRNDGRKLYNLYFDNNYLWGAAPTNVERTMNNVLYDVNCWDCPLRPNAEWNASCALGTPCLEDVKTETRTSPEPTWSSGYGKEKDLTRPPVCKEPPAERFTYEGPSCVPEPPDSLYENVGRCQTELFLNRTITEDEVRTGVSPSITINFTDDAALPFFAPSVFNCSLPENPNALGPRGWDFTEAMRQGIVTGTTSTKSEPMGWNALRSLLVSPSSLSLRGTHPYIQYPTEMVLGIRTGSGYDISEEEVVTVRVGREVTLTPFGPQVNDVWFTIVPTEGRVVGRDMTVNESAVKTEGVTVTVRLEEGETWACGECMVGVSTGVTEDWTGAEQQTHWAVNHTRTCSWGCAFPRETQPFTVTCPDNHTMSTTILLPDYNLNEVQTEVINLSFPASCYKSGLQAHDAFLLLTVEPVIEPTMTTTVTVYKTGTATDTETATVSVSVSNTVTETMSQTGLPIPLCLILHDSVLCGENSVGVHTLFVLLSLLAVGVATAGGFWLFCAKKLPEVEVRVSRVEVHVDTPPPVVTVNVNKVPEPAVDIRVRRVDEPPPSGITVTARKQATGEVTITASAVKTNTPHPPSSNTSSTGTNPLSSLSGTLRVKPTFNTKLL